MLGPWCRGRKLQRFLIVCLFIVTCVLVYTSLRHAPPVLEEGRLHKRTHWEENDQQVLRRGIHQQDKGERRVLKSATDSEGNVRAKRTETASQSDGTPDVDLQLLGYSEVEVTRLNAWPLPQSLLMAPQDGPVCLNADFSMITVSRSAVLQDGIERYRRTLQSLASASQDGSCGSSREVIHKVYLKVQDDDEELSLDTSYVYSVTVEASVGVIIRADSPYGALYGLETVSQLFADGYLGHSHIHIEDHPDYRHRGFMLDTGRRFVPKELLLNFLDAMSYLKMNVFHWHLSDYCIFSIESKIFPQLTSCYDENDRYYTQEDAREVVQYAKSRGIRVIPEVDIPGHARGMRCLSGNISFCSWTMNQVYNDPGGQSVGVLKKLLEEIMEIFPDEYIHIGGDETWFFFFLRCNFKNVNSLETAIAQFILDKGRRPIAWQELLQAAHVDIPGLVLQAWTDSSAGDLAKTGHPSIESRKEWYYFDYPYGPRDHWTLWNSPLGMEEENSPYQHLVLGGEFAVWGDEYTKTKHCWGGLLKLLPSWAYWMHDKAHDEQLMDSMAGQVWPRGVATAGRFWHHVPGLDKQELADRVDRQAQIMISRGVRSCPIGCDCDCATRCGIKYPRST